MLAGLVVLTGVRQGVDGIGGSETAATTPDPTPIPTPTPDEGSGDGNPASNGIFEVHVSNITQSIATLVVGPTVEPMLIDTGDFTDNGEHVLRYPEAHDVGRINHLVVSHTDADHIGGNAVIIEHSETKADGIGAVYDRGIPASTQTYHEYLDAIKET